MKQQKLHSTDAPNERPGETLDAVLDRRISGIIEWLREHAPQIDSDQRHLDAGTVEQAYWHYGYVVALRDVRNSLSDPSKRVS